ncbi:MAG: cytochrome C oxidase subunit IV family protein [Flavobacterium sp.]|jgi:cytochrome c oxidase subunit 4
MASEHNLAIFRGALKFKNNQQKIWGVFIFLSLVTIVEVGLGIVKPAFLVHNKFLHVSLLNIIFLVLTIVKAYYITWDFMHMRDEKSSLRRSVVWTFVFLAIYLAFIVLVEGDYIFEVIRNSSLRWNI